MSRFGGEVIVYVIFMHPDVSRAHLSSRAPPSSEKLYVTLAQRAETPDP